MNLPNDLIKSTDLEKAKDRIIHEFKCVNGKIIQNYALGGEHELTTQEIVDCLNGLATIDCDLQTAYAYITGQDSKIKILEKALKLACETFCSGSHPEMRLEIKNFALISGVEKYFKSQAEKELANG